MTRDRYEYLMLGPRKMEVRDALIKKADEIHAIKIRLGIDLNGQFCDCLNEVLFLFDDDGKEIPQKTLDSQEISV